MTGRMFYSLQRVIARGRHREIFRRILHLLTIWWIYEYWYCILISFLEKSHLKFVKPVICLVKNAHMIWSISMASSPISHPNWKFEDSDAPGRCVNAEMVACGLYRQWGVPDKNIHQLEVIWNIVSYSNGVDELWKHLYWYPEIQTSTV